MVRLISWDEISLSDTFLEENLLSLQYIGYNYYIEVYICWILSFVTLITNEVVRKVHLSQIHS